jgi:hypothetical protein
VQLARKLGEDVAGPRVGGAAPATPRRLPVPMDLPIPFDANGLETVSMALQNRMMTLVAFLQAQNCSNLPGSWRHPATMLDFLTPEYYQRIARTLEDGKIQMAFLDDRLALPDIYTAIMPRRLARACGR